MDLGASKLFDEKAFKDDLKQALFEALQNTFPSTSAAEKADQGPVQALSDRESNVRITAESLRVELQETNRKYEAAKRELHHWTEQCAKLLAEMEGLRKRLGRSDHDNERTFKIVSEYKTYKHGAELRKEA
jgi:hypothetical protein